MKKADYSKMRELLIAQETFPLRFTYKFIGRNTPAFLAAVLRFEGEHPTLTLESSRQSANQQHVSRTYVFDAPNVDVIIEIYKRIEKLEDVLVML